MWRTKRKYNKALTDLSIEAHRTNEENYRCSLFAIENNDLKEKLTDSIPKSVIREKIEEYKNVGKCTTHNGLIGGNYKEWREYIMQDEIDILQEILEG